MNQYCIEAYDYTKGSSKPLQLPLDPPPLFYYIKFLHLILSSNPIYFDRVSNIEILNYNYQS